MKAKIDYKEINRTSWNNKVSHHLHSDFYDMEGFRSGKSSLKDIELSLLGDISGKAILHLQCHFGQDTISIARMRANVVGVDLADKAIAVARDLSQEMEVNAEFICCDLYDLPKHLSRKFDVVFTSYGTICWLPDLDKWAQVISNFLKPQGRLIFVEFHPFVWMFDDDFKNIAYSYFNSGAVVEKLQGTYADRNADLNQDYVEWSHSLSEIVNALLSHNLKIELFNEYNYSPHDCFKHTVEFSPGKFRIQHLDSKIPMTFAIVASVGSI